VKRYMVKIAIFTPILYPFYIELSQILQKYDIEAKVYTHKIFGNYPFEEWLKYAEKIHAIQIFGNTLANPFNFVRRIFKTYNPDIIVIFGCESLSGLILYGLTRLLRRIPVVIIEENNITKLKGLKRILQTVKLILVKHMYRTAPILIAESRASANYVVHILRVERSSNSIYIRPHGVNIHRFKPIEKRIALKYINEKYKLSLKDYGKKVILYVGNFSYCKGFDILIYSIYKLSKKRDDFIVMIPKVSISRLLYDIENTGLKHKILRLICKLKHNKKIIEYPPIRYNDMPMLYGIADIVVLPSRFMRNTSSDRSPNAALEAIACGRTLVASYVGGIPDIAGKYFIPIKPGDTNDLVNKLEVALNNQLSTSKIRQWAIDYLSLERYAYDILGRVKSLLRLK